MTTARRPRPQPEAWLLWAFVVACFLIGGGSRADTTSLVILRPLAALMLTVAVLRIGIPPSPYRWAVALAFAAAALIAAQLVPLPPATWTGLPGRGSLVDAARTTGVALGWHPLSMQPTRTWNALFSLLVPIGALFLGIAVGRRGNQWLLPVLVGCIASSALVGMVQVIGPADGPLYFYRGNRDGFASGLFANRNHHAAVLACMFPLLAALARWPIRQPMRAAALRWTLPAFAIFLVMLLLLTGSRAGLLLGGIGIAGAAWLLTASGEPPASARSPKQAQWGRRVPLLGAIGVVALLVVISIFMARAPSIDRLFGAGMEGGRRAAVYPTVLRMTTDYLPMGTGFGTFAEVFQINEPIAILGPTYLNQAHNDWLQIVIEGGLPALVLALVGIGAFARLSLSTVRLTARGSMTALLGRAGMLILFILGLASIVDYPLRTPSIMVLATVALLWMLDCVRADRTTRGLGVATDA